MAIATANTNASRIWTLLRAGIVTLLVAASARLISDYAVSAFPSIGREVRYFMNFGAMFVICIFAVRSALDIYCRDVGDDNTEGQVGGLSKGKRDER